MRYRQDCRHGTPGACATLLLCATAWAQEGSLFIKTDAMIPVQLGRDLASRIPGAKYIEYPDGEHLYFTGNVETLHGDIEEFVTGHR